MSALWIMAAFVAGIWVGVAIGTITMALLAAHGEREQRRRVDSL